MTPEEVAVHRDRLLAEVEQLKSDLAFAREVERKADEILQGYERQITGLKTLLEQAGGTIHLHGNHVSNSLETCDQVACVKISLAITPTLERCQSTYRQGTFKCGLLKGHVRTHKGDGQEWHTL